MNVNSSSFGSTQTSGSKFRGNFSFNNEHWEALNLPLDDSPQISFTQYTDLNGFSDIPNTVSHIPISSPKNYLHKF